MLLRFVTAKGRPGRSFAGNREVLTIDRLHRQGADLADVEARMKFVLDAAGAVLIDATSTPPAIAAGNGGEADCTIRPTRATLEQLLDGALSPAWACTSGRLRVEGSLGVAMKPASRLAG